MGAAPAPPASPIPAVRTARPGPVRVAVLLLFLCAAATTLSTLIVFSLYPNARFQAFSILQSLGFIVLWFVVIAFLWQGHAWARIVTLLMVVGITGTVAFSLLRVAGSSSGMNPRFAFPIAIGILRFAALILLFGSESNAWFASRR